MSDIGGGDEPNLRDVLAALQNLQQSQQNLQQSQQDMSERMRDISERTTRLESTRSSSTSSSSSSSSSNNNTTVAAISNTIEEVIGHYECADPELPLLSVVPESNNVDVLPYADLCADISSNSSNPALQSQCSYDCPVAPTVSAVCPAGTGIDQHTSQFRPAVSPISPSEVYPSKSGAVQDFPVLQTKLDVQYAPFLDGAQHRQFDRGRVCQLSYCLIQYHQ
jgi:hypothetical protein